MMDMSDAFGPELMDVFSITRQAQTLVLGRASIATSSVPGLYGVITAANKNDVERLPEGTKFSSGISVVTQAEVYPAGTRGGVTYQPDIIEWQGSQYLVVHVDKYKHAGAGFWQVLAESITTVEPI